MHKKNYRSQLSVLFTGLFLSIFSSPYFFYDDFKWLIVYLTSIILLITELYFYKTTAPSIRFISDKNMLIGILLIVTGYISSALLHFNTPYYAHILDWMCCFQIARSSFNLAHRDPTRTIKTINLVFIFSTLLIAVTILFNLNKTSFYFLGPLLQFFFGNKNLLAEYLGASFITQFFCFEQNYKNKIWDFFFLLSLIITSTLIGMTLCRSVWLGCQLSSLYFLIINWHSKKTKSYLILIAVLFFSLSTYPSFKILNTKITPYTQAGKIISTNIRKARWVNTLFMVKDNWFGIGPGNYEFGYTKYHSKWKEDIESVGEVIIKSPHNSYLELLVEGGVLSFLGLIFIIYSIMKRKNITSNEYFLSIGFFIYLATDAMFAFPLETGTTFFISSIFIGLYLSSLPLAETKIYLKKRLFLKYLFLFLLVPLSFASSLSVYLEYNNNADFDKIKLACDIFPGNWRACIKKADIEIENREFDKSIITLQNILKRNQNNFTAIDSLGRAYWEKGEFKKACDTIFNFDSLFLNKSHLHDFYKNNCR